MFNTLTLNVKVSCLLSSIAYCQNPQQALNSYLPGWKIVWNPNALNGTYAFVACDPTQSMYALAIRGSLLQFTWQAFDNWIYQDLDVLYQKPWPFTQGVANAQIALGAYNGWNDLLSMADVSTKKSLWTVLSAIPAASGITIIGHSLGGNLATVYASWLHYTFTSAGKPRTNISVCTFAAPAAGNQFFAQDFDNKLPNSLRVESINDVVPKFPVVPKVIGLGNLYKPAPDATKILVGYKNYSMYLSQVFDTVAGGILFSEYENGFYINGSWTNSTYTQPDGSGLQLNVPVSGRYSANDVTDFFDEVGYQHSINQYSLALRVPIVVCVPSLIEKKKPRKNKAKLPVKRKVKK